MLASRGKLNCKESIALRILPEELGCWGDSVVAKRDFASKEEAEEAARRLAGWGLNMIVYQYCDPVTGVKEVVHSSGSSPESR